MTEAELLAHKAARGGMTSDDVHDAFELVKATSTKAEKERLLKAFLRDELFRFCIVQALDPRIRFGVARKTLAKIVGEASGFGESDWGNSTVSVSKLLQSCREGGRVDMAILQHMPETLSSRSWNLIERILLKKPDIGATASTLNKVEPGLIWTFDCMLAKPFEAKRVATWPVAVEPKLDGVRALAVVDPTTSRTEILSRSGKLLDGVQHLGDHLHDLPALYGATADLDDLSDGFVLDGEVVSGSFNETSGSARRKSEKAEDAVFHVFDIVPLGEWRLQNATWEYAVRRDVLTEMLVQRHELQEAPFALLPRYLARDEAEVASYYEAFRAKGLEGAIVKPVYHTYQFKRSFDWMKIKAQETEDLRITGFVEGTGKYAGQLGAVIVLRECPRNGPVDVKVGGGWSDELRNEIWQHQESFRGRLIEVEYHEVTPDGSLRHPRFKRFRDDKDVVGMAA